MVDYIYMLPIIISVLVSSVNMLFISERNSEDMEHIFLKEKEAILGVVSGILENKNAENFLKSSLYGYQRTIDFILEENVAFLGRLEEAIYNYKLENSSFKSLKYKVTIVILVLNVILILATIFLCNKCNMLIYLYLFVPVTIVFITILSYMGNKRIKAKKQRYDELFKILSFKKQNLVAISAAFQSKSRGETT